MAIAGEGCGLQGAGIFLVSWHDRTEAVLPAGSQGIFEQHLALGEQAALLRLGPLVLLEVGQSPLGHGECFRLEPVPNQLALKPEACEQSERWKRTHPDRRLGGLGGRGRRRSCVARSRMLDSASGRIGPAQAFVSADRLLRPQLSWTEHLPSKQRVARSSRAGRASPRDPLRSNAWLNPSPTPF